MKRPWITKGILKAIENVLESKNATKKEELHNLHKFYWNSLNKIPS